MHTVGTARERHVDAIVHDNARGGTAGQRHRARHDRCEINGLEVAFAHLHEVDPGCHRGLHLRKDVLPVTVGHQTDHRGLDVS